MEIELAELNSDGDRDVRQFSWTYDGDRWLVSIHATAPEKYLVPTISGPGGSVAAQVDDLELDVANGLVTLAGPEWDQSYETGVRGRNAHHLLEVWQDDHWRVFRLLWPVGGLSGPPPVPLVTIAQERQGGRWAALAVSFSHRGADGCDTHGLEVLDHGQLRMWYWQVHTMRVLARRTWQIASTKNGVRFRRGASEFRLDTYNGVPATLAADPRDAVHWGYQEVAWHVRDASPAGGEAVAFDRSPRLIECEDDVHDGLIVPDVGASLRFIWPKDVYLVPYRQRGHWVPASTASQLATHAGWDVVLFRHRSGRVVAERLVQHQREFPHSTPPH